MIPADHITIDGDSAWLVTSFTDIDDRPSLSLGRDLGVAFDDLDRPCDGYGCDNGVRRVMGRGDGESCPDCDGTGRDTLTIYVRCEGACKGEGRANPRVEGRWKVYEDCPDCDGYGWTKKLRVSVVPGMVLPIIHNSNAPMLDGARFVEIWDDRRAVAWNDGHNDGVFTLPDAAEPGMWAVKLKVMS